MSKKPYTEKRTSPGNYAFRTERHAYFAQRVRSDYGDFQWIVDRDDKAGLFQVNTLEDVRRNVALDAAR